MKSATFADVFDALADTPEEAANLKARADLLTAIRDRVSAWGLPEGKAAERLGITRPRLNDLTRGKLDKFSLDALVNIAASVHLGIEVRVKELA